MTMDMIIVSLAGGILSLDRVVLQAMLSRPIVAAPVAGIVLGDIYTGLQAGALLELFWIDRLPVGTCLPPNDFLATFLVAASSILAGQHLGQVSRELLVFSILLIIPCGYLGQLADNLIIKSNDALYDGALRAAERADAGAIFRKHLSGVVKQFLVYGGMIFVLLFCAVPLLVYFFPRLPAFCLRALSITYFSLPLLGLAAGLHTISQKRMIPLFCALFLTVSLIMEIADWL